MIITIDGVKCEAEKGEMLVQIARRNGISIPTLCHSDALPGLGSCRLCMVEVIDRGRKNIVASCIYPVRGEIEVFTHSEKIRSIRKNLLMLLYARAPQDETINNLRKEYGVPDNIRFSGKNEEHCILCGLCVKACEELGSSAISTVNRGVTKKVSTPYDEPSSQCIGCGACASVCPTDAIRIEESEDTRTIWNKTFELIKCEKCGKPFATKEQLQYINKELGVEPEEILCEKCKKTETAEKLKDIFERV